MALNKSKNNKHLLSHVTIYSFVMCLLLSPFIGFYNLQYAIIVYSVIWTFLFIVHFATDYVTSRLVAKYFSVKNYHIGFNIIGIDQILHYIQMYAVIYFLNHIR